MIRLRDDQPLVVRVDDGEHVLELRRSEAGVKPNGRSFATTVMNFYSFDDEGRIVNDVAAVGIAGILQGIGAVGYR